MRKRTIWSCRELRLTCREAGRDKMKKPFNNFAFALVLCAAFYVALTIPDIVEILRQPVTLQSSPRDATYIQSFAMRDIVAALRATVFGAGSLLGLAAIVEIADRILWTLRDTARLGKS